MKLCLSCGISCMEEIMGKQEPHRVAILFGAQIAAKRKEKGITQEALAEVLGISQESLSRMEKGQIAPRFERLQDFSQALDCSIADLFAEPKQQTIARASASTCALVSIFSKLPANTQQEIIEIVTRIVSLLSYSNKN